MGSEHGRNRQMQLRTLVRMACYCGTSVLLAGVIGVWTGCFGNECDQSELNTKANGGHLIDANTWESASAGEPWIEYNGQRVVNFDTTLLGNRMPTNFSVFISADPLGERFTPAGGNVVNIFGVRPGNVSLQNNTCAQYYVRIVVAATPTTGGTDGGTDGAPLDSSADANPT